MLISDKAHDPDIYIQLLRACACFVETTMQVEANAYAQLTDYDRLAARPELRYVNPIVLNAFWLKPNNPYLKGRRRSLNSFINFMWTRKNCSRSSTTGSVPFRRGHGFFLNPMIVGGESLHSELNSLVEAGLTPYQAIKAATSPDPARPTFQDFLISVFLRLAALPTPCLRPQPS